MRVLLIEDDRMIADALTRALGAAGMDVDWARDGEEGEAALRDATHAVVLLDLGLPLRDGFDLLAALRRRGDRVPLMVVSARDDLDSRVRGLDLGADDYLVKPFEMTELLARMRALLRRQAGHASSTIGTEDLTLDLATHRLSFRGTAETLPAREFALMRALLERPGQILSRSQLEDRIYGWGNEVESNAIDVLIHYVRRKFGAEVIRNVRGVGWLVTPLMSLRRATLLTLAALLTLIGLVAALASYWLAGREANAFLDLQLRQVAGFAAALETSGPADDLPPHDSDDDFAVEIHFADSRADICLPGPCRFPDAPAAGFAKIHAGGRDWHVFALALPDRTVLAGQQVEVRREMASGAALAALLPLLLAIPLVWLVIDTVLRRAFRRLARVTEAIGARDAADTTDIPLDHVPAEVRPLVIAMNGLLARLRGLMDQQRAFVADAAHQLRTPLAALTLEVGNLRSGAGGTFGDTGDRLSFVEAAVRRASGLVAQLLRLARQEAGPGRTRVPVALRPVVTDTIGALAPLAISREVDLGLITDVETSHAAEALGDADDFRTLFEVVLENALRYTPPGGTVDVGMRAVSAGTEIAVRDTGPGIPPEALPRVFERFFRVDGREAEGSGLGLAIAEVIARRHGVTLALRNRPAPGGLEAILTFPSVSTQAAARSGL